eukprot:8018528-Pyramimonas_sp.AAC.1
MFNDLYVRVYSIEAFDQFTLDYPRVHLASYVDTNSLTAVGDTDNEVLSEISQAAAAMYIRFRHYLRVQFQADKLTTFASSLPLAQELAGLLGGMAGFVTNSAVVLGRDIAMGQKRSSRNRLWKRKQGARCMRQRHRVHHRC